MSTRIVVVTGTRADFGLWRPVLSEFSRVSRAVDVRLLVTAMHLDARFGETVTEVRAAGLPILAEVPCTPSSDAAGAMAAALGEAIEGIAGVVEQDPPDWVLVLGDRGEQLAAALVALHLGCAVGHLHGGERTAGAVDDVLRDQISRIAHLHLVASSTARERLLARGEADWRVRVVGAPGLDAIQHDSAPSAAELRLRYHLPAAGPYLMVIVHPETGAGAAAPHELTEAVLDALAHHRLPVVAIWPNADAGGRTIAARLERARDRFAFLAASLPHADYVGLLRNAAALVGNSSSGLIEAPFLGVPAVNVGRRQEGRQRGDNVIDTPVDGAMIGAAIQRAINPAFRASLSGRSPYGDGRAAPRIVEAVLGATLDERLLMKEDV